MAEEKQLKDILMAQFKKDFKESPLEQMDDSDMASIPGYITTGNKALNWIVSKDINKGLPMGRVVLLTGDAGSGKSMIALSMMREPSIDTVIYLDSEGGGVTKEFADFLGIDPAKILYSQIDTIEELIEKMRTIIDTVEKNKSTKNILMVIDSMSMISTAREKDEKGGQDMGNKAKQTRTFFRTYTRKMQKLNICCVMTAHLTQNIGGYGPDKVVSGGTILQYIPSVEVRFASVSASQGSVVEKSARGTSLQKIRAEIMKSRFGTKGKRVVFNLDMQKGLDPYAGLFDILKDYQFIIPALSDFDAQIAEKKVPKKGNGWWCFKPWEGVGKGDDEATGKLTPEVHQKLIDNKLSGEGKFQESKFYKYCEDNPWLLEDIQKILDSIYADVEEDIAKMMDKKVEEVKTTKKKTPKAKKEAEVEITELDAGPGPEKSAEESA